MNDTHTSPLRVRYGVSFMSYRKKMTDISRAHCIWTNNDQDPCCNMISWDHNLCASGPHENDQIVDNKYILNSGYIVPIWHCCHLGNIFITGSKANCQKDDFWSSQCQNLYENVNISITMTEKYSMEIISNFDILLKCCQSYYLPGPH